MLRDTFAVYKAHWKVLIPVTMVVLAPQAIGDALIGDVEVEGVKRPEDVLKLAAFPSRWPSTSAARRSCRGSSPRS